MRWQWAAPSVTVLGLFLTACLGPCGSCLVPGHVNVRTPDAAPNSASVAGRVVRDPGDQPVGEYDLDVIPYGPTGGPAPPRWTVHVTHGRFLVEHLPRGSYDLAARTADHRAGGIAIAEPRELADGDHYAQLIIRVTGGLWIHGVVVDQGSGAPIAGARLHVANGASCRDCLPGYTTSAISGADGRFDLAGIYANGTGPTVGFQVTAPGYTQYDGDLTAPHATDAVVPRTLQIALQPAPPDR